MASIRERNGKFNVIYSYTNEKGERKQKWETYETKAEAKRPCPDRVQWQCDQGPAEGDRRNRRRLCLLRCPHSLRSHSGPESEKPDPNRINRYPPQGPGFEGIFYTLWQSAAPVHTKKAWPEMGHAF